MLLQKATACFAAERVLPNNKRRPLWGALNMRACLASLELCSLPSHKCATAHDGCICSAKTMKLGSLLGTRARALNLQLLWTGNVSISELQITRTLLVTRGPVKLKLCQKNASKSVKLLCSRTQLTRALYIHRFGRRRAITQKKSVIRCAQRQHSTRSLHPHMWVLHAKEAPRNVMQIPRH